MNKFRMHGREAQVYRWKAEYTETRPEINPETGEVSGKEAAVTSYFPTKEEAEKTGGTVAALDVSDAEWMDGLVVPDAPDTYAAALDIYEMGEAGYNAKLQRETARRNEQLRADIDYIMLMEDL